MDIIEYYKEWKPTVENINALPEAIRKYIHDLHTNCDPAGIIKENILTTDFANGLQIRVKELLEKNKNLQDSIKYNNSKINEEIEILKKDNKNLKKQIKKKTSKIFVEKDYKHIPKMELKGDWYNENY